MTTTSGSKELLDAIKQMLAKDTMSQRDRDRLDKIRKNLEAEVYHFSK